MKLTNDEMIKAVEDYFINKIKNKFPDLSKENEKIFREEIKPVILNEMSGGYYNGWRQGLTVDNDVSYDIMNAYLKMKIPDYDSVRLGATCALTFPLKLRFRFSRGEYVQVAEYGNKLYLAISDEYKKKQTKQLTALIKDSEAQIPEEVKEKVKADYKSIKSALQNLKIERETVLKDYKKGILNYTKNIEEIENSSLSEEEKATKKSELRENLKVLENAVKQKRSLTDETLLLDKHIFTYGKNIESVVSELLDNPTMLKQSAYINYVKSEKARIFEEYEKKQAEIQAEYEKQKLKNKKLPMPKELLEWPDFSSVPENLQQYYDDLATINNYEEPIDFEKLSTQECEKLSKLFEAIASGISSNLKEFGFEGLRYNDENERNALNKYIKNYLKANINNFSNPMFIKNLNTAISKGLQEFNYSNYDNTFEVKIENNIVFAKNRYKTVVLYAEEQSVKDYLKFVKNLDVFHKDCDYAYHDELLLEALKDYLPHAIEDGCSVLYGNVINIDKLDNNLTV